jgi:hypothetical protein
MKKERIGVGEGDGGGPGLFLISLAIAAWLIGLSAGESLWGTPRAERGYLELQRPGLADTFGRLVSYLQI